MCPLQVCLKASCQGSFKGSFPKVEGYAAYLRTLNPQPCLGFHLSSALAFFGLGGFRSAGFRICGFGVQGLVKLNNA